MKFVLVVGVLNLHLNYAGFKRVLHHALLISQGDVTLLLETNKDTRTKTWKENSSGEKSLGWQNVIRKLDFLSDEGLSFRINENEWNTTVRSMLRITGDA